MSPTPKTGRRTTARLALWLPVVAFLSAGCDVRHVADRAFYLGLPQPITDEAQRIYDLWIGSVAAAAVVGIFVWGLIFFAIIRYRKTSDELPRQVRYNLPIEVLYTVVPFVIIAVLFYYTAVSENFVDKASAKPDLRVNIVGFQWNWQFNYPAAGVQVTGSPTQPAVMWLPADERILFVETSPDVIHSWFVPSFLFKRDVIPGRQNSFEVRIRRSAIGHTFIGRCAEFCGEKHDRMNFFVKIVSSADFDSYIAKLKQDPNATIGNGAGSAIPTGTEATNTAGSNK